MKKGPPDGVLPLCIHSFPPSPPRPSEDTVRTNELYVSGFMRACSGDSEKPRPDFGLPKRGELNLCSKMTKKQSFRETFEVLEKMGLRMQVAGGCITKVKCGRNCDKDA